MAEEERPRRHKYEFVFGHRRRITAEGMLFAAICSMISAVFLIVLSDYLSASFRQYDIVKAFVGVMGFIAGFALCTALYFGILLIFLRTSDNRTLSWKWSCFPTRLLPTRLDLVELADDNGRISRIRNRVGTWLAGYIYSPMTTNPRRYPAGTPRNAPRRTTSRHMIANQVPRTSNDTSHELDSLPWDSEPTLTPQSKFTSGEFANISLGSLSSRNEVFRPRLDTSTGSSGAADIGGELSTVPESSRFDVDEDGSESLELFFPPQSRHSVGCKKRAAAKNRPVEADSGHGLAIREQPEGEQEPDVAVSKNVPESSPVSTESSRILSSPEQPRGEPDVGCKNSDVPESSPVNAELSRNPLHSKPTEDSQVPDVVFSKEPAASRSPHVSSGTRQKTAKSEQSASITPDIISGEPGEQDLHVAADCGPEHESEQSVDVKLKDSISEEPGSQGLPYNLEALKTRTEKTLSFSTEQLADRRLPVEKEQESGVLIRGSAFLESSAGEVGTLKGGCVPNEQSLSTTAISENPDGISEDSAQPQSAIFHSEPSIHAQSESELPSAPREMRILEPRTESLHLQTRSEPLELASKIEKSSGNVEEEGNYLSSSV